MLDWVDVEKSGFSHLPPVEPLLAYHLHPITSTMTSAGPTLPSKADSFQSSLTKKGLQSGGHVCKGSECVVTAFGLPGRVAG